MTVRKVGQFPLTGVSVEKPFAPFTEVFISEHVQS
jgi:hypothetical protein